MARDIGMAERGQRLCFALQPGQPIGIVEEGRGERFNGHVAVQARVAGAVDLAHASGAERADDLVGAEACSSGEGHGRNWT